MVPFSEEKQTTGSTYDSEKDRTNAHSTAKVNERPVMLPRSSQNITGLNISVRVSHVMHDLHRAHHMHERLEDCDKVSHVGARKLVQALPLLDHNAWGEYISPEAFGAVGVVDNSESGGHELLEHRAFIQICLAAEGLHSTDLLLKS